MTPAQLWAWICRLFSNPRPTRLDALAPAEIAGVDALRRAGAERLSSANESSILCPECMLQLGALVMEEIGRSTQLCCRCPRCGPVPAPARLRQQMVLDVRWLLQRLGMALVLAPESVTELLPDVWWLGAARLGAYLLSRDLRWLFTRRDAVERLNAAKPLHVIAPVAGELPPLAHVPGVHWLPMQESFRFDGEHLHPVQPAAAQEPPCELPPFLPSPTPAKESDETSQHGPFSQDFRTVYLDDWPEPIRLTAGQAAVMKALWERRGMALTREQVMAKTPFTSAKPGDLFKATGAAARDGARHAYQRLVAVHRRDGTYRLIWPPPA